MKFSKILLLLAVAGTISFKMMAQGSLPDDPDTAVPLDGGLSIAIVAGVSYGAKRLMKNRKVKEESKANNK
ncbi:MAG: hypothetical protein P4L41_17945 [Flavipsychrobacter sp.]|nr:hypothetical protein [Flavipsychrobacter sp.]